MKSRFPDDWGTPLGGEKKTPAEKKKPKEDTLAGLVLEFRNCMLMDTSMLMNAQINGPALMKAFRQILDTGKSYDDVRRMIRQFHKDIQARPLTDGTPAWRAFMGRLDSLAAKVAHSETSYVYDGPKIDPRLADKND